MSTRDGLSGTAVAAVGVSAANATKDSETTEATTFQRAFFTATPSYERLRALCLPHRCRVVESSDGSDRSLAGGECPA